MPVSQVLVARALHKYKYSRLDGGRVETEFNSVYTAASQQPVQERSASQHQPAAAASGVPAGW